MRLDVRRTLIGLFIAGVIAALMLPAIYYSFGLWLAPPRPVPATSHVLPLLGDALWARADGGRATELKPINPISLVQHVACSEREGQLDDETLLGAYPAECGKHLPALAAVIYLSGMHMRDANLAPSFREGHARFVTTIWLTRSWTRAELLDTLAERGEFGPGFRGVEAAAQGFFGRAAAQLTLPQAAMVAAFMGDRGTDPWCEPAAAASLRHRILERMRDNNAIDERAFGAADLSELSLTAPPAKHQSCQG